MGPVLSRPVFASVDHLHAATTKALRHLFPGHLPPCLTHVSATNKRHAHFALEAIRFYTLISAAHNLSA